MADMGKREQICEQLVNRLAEVHRIGLIVGDSMRLLQQQENGIYRIQFDGKDWVVEAQRGPKPSVVVSRIE